MDEEEANPYAAPSVAATRGTAGATRSDANGYEAHYELTGADGAASASARDSKALPLVGFLVVLVGMGTTSFSIVPVGLFLVAFQPGRRIMAERALAALRVSQRRVTAYVREDGVELRDEEGNVSRRFWSDLAVTATPTHLLFQQGAQTFVVPARGFADDATFRAAAQLATARATGRRPNPFRWALVAWVILIVMFVAIWSFFGAAERRPTTAPSTSAS